MIRRIARHNAIVISCGCLGVSVGLLGAIFLFFAWVVQNFTESPSFGPMAWSPDEKRLALGVYEEYHPVGLYIVDADGRHFRKLIASFCDVLENCGGGLIYIEWSDDGQDIHFGIQGTVTQHYAISADGSNLQLVETSENTYPDNIPEPTDIPGTQCDDVDFVGTREMSPGGLLAQSSCSGEDCDICRMGHCTQDLLVCDTKTGKFLFKIDDWDYSHARSNYPFLTRPTGMRLALLLAVIGLIAILVGLVAPVVAAFLPRS